MIHNNIFLFIKIICKCLMPGPKISASLIAFFNKKRYNIRIIKITGYI